MNGVEIIFVASAHRRYLLTNDPLRIVHLELELFFFLTPNEIQN